MAINLKKIEKDFRFVDEVPQPSTGRPRIYTSLANRVKAKPGRWAQVAVGKTYDEIASLSISLRFYGLTVITRKISDKEFIVFAKYEMPKARTRPTKRAAAKRKKR